MHFHTQGSITSTQHAKAFKITFITLSLHLKHIRHIFLSKPNQARSISPPNVLPTMHLPTLLLTSPLFISLLLASPLIPVSKPTTIPDTETSAHLTARDFGPPGFMPNESPSRQPSNRPDSNGENSPALPPGVHPPGHGDPSGNPTMSGRDVSPPHLMLNGSPHKQPGSGPDGNGEGDDSLPRVVRPPERGEPSGNPTMSGRAVVGRQDGEGHESQGQSSGWGDGEGEAEGESSPPDGF